MFSTSLLVHTAQISNLTLLQAYLNKRQFRLGSFKYHQELLELQN